ncbi:MAG: alanine--tRNA ligase [Eubacteriales bacterium]|nr:alanine--tRNA ligase [Eubacteriales bacterium]
MQALGLNEIRERYLRFFESKGHLRLPSFSLVPKDDPSILLINAGMTPMKRYFTGQDKPPCTRVTTCQKCIRTPDIDQVGLTSRHGTFFEMLGNFSFGDYFKEEIIPWAWEFLTEDLEIPAERLYISVYHEDDEAYKIWHETIGIPEERIARLGKEDNFWEHGTGPCGPCSEIHYDRGEAYGSGAFGADAGDRYVEIWNLVFSQFDRQEDGSYLPLKQKNIDTGGGLERFACVMQGVDNLFEVDTIRSILDHVCAIAGKTYKSNERDDVAIRVVTDHIRSTVMMIADGVTPSNTGRGYVLRRLLRRAARYGRLLGIDGLFLTQLAEDVIRMSGDAYPELREHHDYILTIIEKEEERFDRTIRQGMNLLERAIDSAKSANLSHLPSEDVFLLHDTYGFPYDLTREIASESGLELDELGFKKLMQAQKQRAHDALMAKGESAWSGLTLPAEVKKGSTTEFLGYCSEAEEAELEAILLFPEEGSELRFVEALSADEAEQAILIFDRSPFYAEGGGQVGDHGEIRSLDGDAKLFVENVTKPDGKLFLHRVRLLSGEISVGDRLHLEVDHERRMATARNHSSTHLLHKALRDILGEHVKQAGSYVGPDRLRFDFSHFSAIDRETLDAIEKHVNQAILDDAPVVTELMSMQEAKASGAMALFDEKYGDQVRVLTMGASKELCGGTHLKHTSQACYFRIISEQSVAAGVRRIEAVTGAAAMQLAHEDSTRIAALAQSLKTSEADLLERIEKLKEELKSRERELETIKREQEQEATSMLDSKVKQLANASVLVSSLSVDRADALRDACEHLRSKFAPAVIVLASEIKDKLAFCCMVSEPLIERGVFAGNIVKIAAQVAGGGGGGRKDMAQAGARDVSKLDESLAAASTEIERLLG